MEDLKKKYAELTHQLASKEEKTKVGELMDNTDLPFTNQVLGFTDLPFTYQTLIYTNYKNIKQQKN
jgi:hypothetical protein